MKIPRITVEHEVRYTSFKGDREFLEYNKVEKIQDTVG